MDREVITKSKVTVEEERNNGGGISRRSFLKGVGGVAAAAAVLGLSGLKSKALAQPIPRFLAVPKETMLEMYRRMQRIRQGELKLVELMKTDRPAALEAGLRRTGHASIGEEASDVGVCMAMKWGDYLTCSHRSHGHPLAMGLDLKPWMAELFGRVTGTSRGHGGSLHIADPERGLIGAIGIVGAGVPIAVGAAKAAKLRGTKQVAVPTCGDGAMNTSHFNSSLNLAAIWNLPVVFVVNNNQWATSATSRIEQSLTQAGKDLSVRAAGFGIPGITVDGNDVFAVYKAAKYCIDRARDDKGPSMLECKTYRTHPHNEGWQKKHEVLVWPYNNPAELEYWLRRDPIKRFENTIGELLTEKELVSIQQQVDAEVEEAVNFALRSPSSDPEEEYKYIREVFKA